MSAVFMAAGPDIRQGTLTRVNNLDVAPTAARLLGVKLSTLVEGTAIPVRIPRKVKAALADQLAALRPSADRRSAAHLERAIDRFSRSLATSLWADDVHLTRLGAQVFQEERAAVEHLLKIVGQLPAVAGATQDIVAADEELAAIAIDGAVAGSGDERLIGLARQALGKGLAEAASGRYRQALDQYRNAWGLARKAVRE
jgi:arylsulfatase A-like enzyme